MNPLPYSVLFLFIGINLFYSHAAPTEWTLSSGVGGDRRGGDGSRFEKYSSSTIGGESTTTEELDDDGENRAMRNEEKGGGGGEEAESGMGPWAIAGIVLGVVGVIAGVVVAGVAIDRKRRKSPSNNDSNSISEDDPQRHNSKKEPRQIRYVPPGDDSWRGPPPFEEPIQIPGEEMNVQMEDDEDEDEMTILEPLPTKKRG